MRFLVNPPGSPPSPCCHNTPSLKQSNDLRCRQHSNSCACAGSVAAKHHSNQTKLANLKAHQSALVRGLLWLLLLARHCLALQRHLLSVGLRHPVWCSAQGLTSTNILMVKLGGRVHWKEIRTKQRATATSAVKAYNCLCVLGQFQCTWAAMCAITGTYTSNDGAA